MPTPAPRAREPRLLDRLADALHQRRFTPVVNPNYVSWVRHYSSFHQIRHPRELGVPEVAAFLEHLARPDETTLFEVAEGAQRRAADRPFHVTGHPGRPFPLGEGVRVPT